jgi:hypothetical protein
MGFTVRLRSRLARENRRQRPDHGDPALGVDVCRDTGGVVDRDADRGCNDSGE